MIPRPWKPAPNVSSHQSWIYSNLKEKAVVFCNQTRQLYSFTPGKRRESYNDIVQVVVQQVRQCLLHHFLFRHPFKTVNFPLHLLEVLIYFLLLPICWHRAGLLGLWTRFGFWRVWVFGWFRCLGDFRWFGFLGLS